MELSVLLLAAQQAITFSDAYSGVYENFAGLTQFYQDVVPISNMNDYLLFVINEFSDILASSKMIFNKEDILDSIHNDYLFKSYMYEDSSTLSSNIIYDHNKAKAIMFSYLLSSTSNDCVDCELLIFTINLKLQEDFLIFHRENKTKNKHIEWAERVHIPSTLNQETVISAFSTILSPLIQSNFTSSSQFVAQLKDSAHSHMTPTRQTFMMSSRLNMVTSSSFLRKSSFLGLSHTITSTLISEEWLSVSKTLSLIHSIDDQFQWEIRYSIL